MLVRVAWARQYRQALPYAVVKSGQEGLRLLVVDLDKGLRWNCTVSGGLDGSHHTETQYRRGSPDKFGAIITFPFPISLFLVLRSGGQAWLRLTVCELWVGSQSLVRSDLFLMLLLKRQFLILICALISLQYVGMMVLERLI